ncbi:uncharacterized protein PRCAT00003020001 [Priceomyces carsonii]|uniref:uncharacterized protein n=1 Tax=Priceomyces carsonii TaxID=28549 RepID=UPI002ED9F2A3|nr:unnamed protein product [Priceomyces carsonii]
MDGNNGEIILDSSSNNKGVASKKRKIGKKTTQSNTSTNENRRSAQASRTLKACDLCRKQKTRCFRSPDNPKSCLRCKFLDKICSFESNPEPLQYNNSNNAPSQTQGTTGEESKKIDMIYSGVTEILTLLKSGANNFELLNNDAKLLLDAASSMKKSSEQESSSSLSYFDNLYQGGRASAGFLTTLGGSSLSYPLQSQDMDTIKEFNVDNDTQSSFQSPTNSLKVSPFSVVNNQVDNNYIPQPINKLLNLSTVSEHKKSSFFESKNDLLSLGILSESEAIDLINDFRRNYGRWVSFPQNLPTSVLIERIRYKSSLLLTTCCCLSMRYSLNGVSPGDVDNLRRKKKTYKAMFKHLIKDLGESLLGYAVFQRASDNSGDIEFLQALVILSIYLLSLSSIVTNTLDEESLLDESDLDLKNMNLDPWFLSGLGLKTFVTKSTFGAIFDNKAPSLDESKDLLEDSRSPFTILYDEMDSDDDQVLTMLRIYNHLTLVHLINCIFSGRMCILDEIRLNYCNATLSLPSATNFDGRMVSEISILLIAYNYIQVNLNAGMSASLKECETGFISVKDEIRIWYDQWEHLFNQPALQFVEFCFNFCLVVIYYSYNFQKLNIKNKGSNNTLGGNGRLFLDLYGENNIGFILPRCDKQSLIKMTRHANNVVKSINVIESDSYFAYLSDQIHFCFYFSAIILIKLLKYFKTSEQLDILDGIELDKNSNSESAFVEIKTNIDNLIEKYGRIGQGNSDDIITKYKFGLEDVLKKELKA